MKKLLIFLIFFLVTPAFAIEEAEVILPDFGENVEETFKPKGDETKFELAAEKLFSQKEINFENRYFNKLYYGVNFRSSLNFNIENSNLHTRYPFLIEPYIQTTFGENKNEFRFSFAPTRSIDGVDLQFWEKISDLYYIRNFNEKHRVLIGNSRTPIGFEGAQSQYTIPFVNRSQIANNFGNARAMGIRFMGDLGYVDYDIGGYSSTRYLQQLDKGLELVGWLGYKPFYKWDESILKNLKIGAGANYGRNDGQYTVLTTGVKWDYDKFYFAGEYGYANGYNGSLGYSQNKAQGFNATLGYNLTEKWQLLGRYDYFNPNTAKSDNNVQQYTMGVNYFVLKERLRLGANYIFEQNKKQGNKNIVLIMLQFMI